MSTAAAPQRLNDARIGDHAAAASADRGRLALGAAALVLAIALLLPWWSLTMHAPQYPQGLTVTTWVFRVTGDVSEVDGLNHYIGFMKLADIAAIERRAAFVAAPAIVLCLILGALVRGRPRALLALPAVFLPVFFLGDLAAWLWYAGHHLDPHAALSSSVTPWTPHILGVGGVGQFTTVASFGVGFYLALFAAIVAAYGAVLALRAPAPQR